MPKIHISTLKGSTFCLNLHHDCTVRHAKEALEQLVHPAENNVLVEHQRLIYQQGQPKLLEDGMFLFLPGQHGYNLQAGAHLLLVIQQVAPASVMAPQVPMAEALAVGSEQQNDGARAGRIEAQQRQVPAQLASSHAQAPAAVMAPRAQQAATSQVTASQPQQDTQQAAQSHAQAQATTYAHAYAPAEPQAQALESAMFMQARMAAQ